MVLGLTMAIINLIGASAMAGMAGSSGLRGPGYSLWLSTIRLESDVSYRNSFDHYCPRTSGNWELYCK